MPRLTFFAKANCDVVDALFGCSGPEGRWEGLNQALREGGEAWRVRLHHETFVRSDTLLQCGPPAPDALLRLDLPWPHPANGQLSTAFFETMADAYALSIQADVTMSLARHRDSGRLFYPGPLRSTSAELRAWLRRECEPAPLLTPEESQSNFRALAARLRASTRAPLFIFNLSTVVPGEQIGALGGGAETLSRRIKRFNLMIEELSELPGVHVVDVDRLVARAGADRLKLDGVRLNVEGSRLAAYEVLRQLTQIGAFLQSRDEDAPPANQFACDVF